MQFCLDCHRDLATGVVVKHQMGRPIKVDGTPRHPASLGATDVLGQAQALDFYHPDRAWAITAHGFPSDQSSLHTALTAQRVKIAASRGNGFHILTGAITSPTLAGQLDALLALYPKARWHWWQATLVLLLVLLAIEFGVSILPSRRAARPLVLIHAASSWRSGEALKLFVFSRSPLYSG